MCVCVCVCVCVCLEVNETIKGLWLQTAYLRSLLRLAIKHSNYHPPSMNQPLFIQHFTKARVEPNCFPWCNIKQIITEEEEVAKPNHI